MFSRYPLIHTLLMSPVLFEGDQAQWSEQRPCNHGNQSGLPPMCEDPIGNKQ